MGRRYDYPEMCEAVEVRVAGSVRHVSRRLWSMLVGPEPPAEFESNGAGPGGRHWLVRLAAWLVPDELHGWPIWLPAHFHDYAYSSARPLGGTWRSRRQADAHFARNLYTVISEAGVLSAPRIALVSLLYWLGVRAGGWACFCYAPGEAPVSALERARERAALPWVSAALARINAAQAEVEARWRAKAEASKPKPEATRPRPPVVATARDRFRRVLIVGINAYRRSQLRGCVNDATVWAELYRAGGWHVEILLDGAATQAAILDTLTAWAAVAEPGDEIGLVFSGHGTRLPDRADPTGEVAALVSADALDFDGIDWFAERCITHREIASVVNGLPDGALFHAVIDACHSGLPKESIEAARQRGLVSLDGRLGWRVPRFMEPPGGVLPLARGDMKPIAGPDVVKVQGLKTLLLSGCRQSQTSADAYLDGRFCGAFSRMMQTRYVAMPDSHLEPLIEAAAAGLAAGKFDQIPGLHGDPSRFTEPPPWRKKEAA